MFETEGVVGREVEDRFRERSSSKKQYCPLPVVSTKKTVKTWTEFMHTNHDVGNTQYISAGYRVSILMRQIHVLQIKNMSHPSSKANVFPQDEFWCRHI